MKERCSLKNIVFLICQLAILLLAYFLVWSDAILVLGLAASIAQCVLRLKLVGWVSALAYPVTYWCAGLFDTPQGGNQYVYWYFSYVGITILVLIADLILKRRKKTKKSGRWFHRSDFYVL